MKAWYHIADRRAAAARERAERLSYLLAHQVELGLAFTRVAVRAYAESRLEAGDTAARKARDCAQGIARALRQCGGSDAGLVDVRRLLPLLQHALAALDRQLSEARSP